VGEAGLEQGDVGGERAGAGRIIKFHRIFLPSDYWFGRRERLNAYA
jgi:hypothetical protein